MKTGGTFDAEFAGYIIQYGDEEPARAVIEADHVDALRVRRHTHHAPLYP